MAVNYGLLLNQQDPGEQIQRGILSGLQISAMQSQADQQRIAQEQAAAQAQRAAQFQQAFGLAWQSGDKQAVTSLIGQFPEQFEQIKQAAGFRDEQQTKALGSLGIQIANALSSGNPQAAGQIIAANAAVLRAAGPGYEPESLLQRLNEDPQGLAKQADLFSLAALGPEQYYKVQGEREGRAVQMRGQDIQVRGQDISASTAAADRAATLQAAAVRANATMQAAATKAAAGNALGAKDLLSINKDLTAFTKEHGAMYSAAQDLETLRKRNTPAAQLAAIFKYMKALDPTSVVREGEQVMVQRTDGVFGTMANYVSQLQSGIRLNDKQMADLEITAKQLANSAAAPVNDQFDSYLSSFGNTIPEAQRKQLESRKPKLFEVPSDAVAPSKTASGNPAASANGGWEIIN